MTKDVDWLRRMVDEGLTAREIAERRGTNVHCIYKTAYRRGIRLNRAKRGRPRLPPSSDPEVNEARERERKRSAALRPKKPFVPFDFFG